MIETVKKDLAKTIRQKRKQLQTIREEVEDILDHLDVLEARVRDRNKPRLTHDQVKKRYRIK